MVLIDLLLFFSPSGVPLDQLEAILVLVVSWHKLEFKSWPVLLDEVQHQYDINAGKVIII